MSIGGLIQFGGSAASGTGGGGGTGNIESINQQEGPDILILSGSGINVVTTTNTITIHSSGINKYVASFTNSSSVALSHGLTNSDVMVQVRDNQSPPRVIIPDEIIFTDANTVTVNFNFPLSGRVLILG